MQYNLLDNHKKVARWLVEQYRDGRLREEFHVSWVMGDKKYILSPFNDEGVTEYPEITRNTLQILDREQLILLSEIEQTPSIGRKYTQTSCSLLQRIFTAVDTDFGNLPIDISTSPDNASAVGLNLGQFSQIIARDFNDEELKMLCANMSIRYQDLPGSNTISNKALELVLYASRHGRLLELLILSAKARPKTDWSDLY